MTSLHSAIPLNLLILVLLLLVLLGLLAWAIVKVITLSRNDEELDWQPDEADQDGRSRYDRITNFLNYPWS